MSWDVRFLCPPLCLRKGPELSVMWSAYENRGDIQLFCWIQTGVEAHTFSIPLQNGVKKIMFVDDTGEVAFVQYEGDQRYECFKNGKKESIWKWDGPSGDTKYIQSFSGTECMLTKEKFANEFVLLSVSDETRWFVLSSVEAPKELEITPSRTVRFSSGYSLTNSYKLYCTFLMTPSQTRSFTC